MHELNEQILNEQISLAAHLIEHSAVPKNFATRRIFNDILPRILNESAIVFAS